MIRQARGYFGIDAKAYGHVGHVDLSALKVCIEYTAGAAGPLSACRILPRMHTLSCRARHMNFRPTAVHTYLWQRARSCPPFLPGRPWLPDAGHAEMQE